MLAVDGPPADEVPIEQARAGHEAETKHLSGPGEPVAEVRDVAVPAPCGAVPVRVYRPEGEGPLPLVVYVHGGGWMLGSVESFDTVVRALANAAGAMIASIEYRLAPEHPFPAGLDDVLCAVRWLAANAAELGADPERMAIAGDSAGGNLATVAARRLRGEVDLRLQALVYPVTDAGVNTPSYREFGEGYGLTAASMQRFWNLYLDGADGLDPDASPLRCERPRGLAARARADRGRRPAARRGRGLRRGAARGGRPGRGPARRGHRARLLALARGDLGLAPHGRRGRRRAARRARLSGRSRTREFGRNAAACRRYRGPMATAQTTATTRFWHPFADMGAVSQRELLIERGEGVWVYDADDRRYLDGTASLWYANIGHGRAEVADAVAAQMRRLEAYQTFGDFGNRPANELAERLAALRADGRRPHLPRLGRRRRDRRRGEDRPPLLGRSRASPSACT